LPTHTRLGRGALALVGNNAGQYVWNCLGQLLDYGIRPR
jgi:hypothetical protein